MELTSNNILTVFLALFIILCLYNDYIKPFISNLIQGKSLKNAITESFSSQTSSQYSSLSPSLSNTVQFDTNTYLRNANKPIILNNQISLPVILYANPAGNGSYHDLVANYFRNHIYPIQSIQTLSNIDTLYKFINNEVDIAFISEEILARYIKRDCKYLTRILADTFALDTSIPGNNLENSDVLDRLYPELNIEAIGVGFNVDLYLVVGNFSDIIEFMDIIKGKSIGILADSYYFFLKLCMAYGLSMDIINTITNNGNNIEPILETLNEKFIQNKYDGIFIVCHPKNLQLLKLSLTKKLRYIHIQKREKLDARNNLNSLQNLTNTQQGTGSAIPPPPPSSNTQAIYSQTVMNDLKTINIKENFNSLIKKYFQHLTPRAVDLNKFHKSGNTYSYLDTYSTRMILIIRDSISDEKVEYITRNYIDNLEKMRNGIDRDNFDIELNNFSSLEFIYNELISFDKVIPLAEGARKVYKEEGLIYYEDDYRCIV
jgi:hypothetical protein